MFRMGINSCGDLDPNPGSEKKIFKLCKLLQVLTFFGKPAATVWFQNHQFSKSAPQFSRKIVLCKSERLARENKTRIRI
jgi:hypothetical protein